MDSQPGVLRRAYRVAMITKEQALENFRRHLREEGRLLDAMTPLQVAERVWTEYRGPSKEEIADKFARERCRRPGYPEEYIARQAAAELAGKRGLACWMTITPPGGVGMFGPNLAGDVLTPGAEPPH